jgi:stage V sporulation protein R
MREMDMFQYEPRGDEMVITKVSDESGWREVKAALLKSVGLGTVPVIKIVDADHNQNRTLYMQHAYDDRDLQQEYAERTLGLIYRLWGHEVVLETIANGQKTLLSYGETGFHSGNSYG